jgi:MoaA/NifB/PqqE/SkfB family radical SAM enzyme
MIELPWDRKTVPHCVLEINQECNLDCRACYREKTGGSKSVGSVLYDLETIENNQDVQTVSVAGGEPTLHPDLVDIVSKIHQRGHSVSLVTNGLLLTDDLLKKLKMAGLDIVMIHVDEGQNRPDLPENPSVSDINNLRKQIAKRVAVHGLDAGLCVTIYKDCFENLKELYECMISSPDINFLFATHAVEIDDIVMYADRKEKPDHAVYRSAPTRNSDVIDFYEKHFQVRPYACIPPRQPDETEKPCISYFVPVLHGVKHSPHPVNSTNLDLKMIRLSRVVKGKYLYYCKNNWFLNAIQLIANGIADRRIISNLSIVLKSMLPGVTLRSKRLVFENAPIVMPDGTVNCCDFCPNSTARNGTVIPVCLADHMEEFNAEVANG